MNIDQIILSNSIRSYLFVASVLVVTLLIKRLVSRFFASLIYTWVDKKNHSELRKNHVHRLLVPIEQFLLFLVAIIAIYELKFPAAWDLNLFKLSLQQLLEAVVKLMFIVLLIRVTLRTLEFIAIILENKARLTKDLSDDQLVLFFRDFFKVIVYIIGVLLVLRYVFNEIEMDLQLSVSTSAQALADFAHHLRDFLRSENDLNSYQVFVSESGKQHHALHVECLVNMQMDIDAFQVLRERINLAAIEYANAHQIQFSEKG